MTSSLAAQLTDQPQFLGNRWLAGLEERKQEEAEFHDTERSGERELEVGHVAGNAHWYGAAKPVTDYIERWIKDNAPGKDVLDYACGSGPMALRFAKAGASFVVGIDISEVSVRNAEHAAIGLSNVRFLQRDCEATGLPDNAFDLILCSGMLHHLDLTRAFPELHRILKPGGRIFCGEALNYNPAIKLYRRLTPELRTGWEAEHILSMKDIRYAQKWFTVEGMHFFCMASPLATLLPLGKARDVALSLGHAIDKVLTRTPLVQLWSWQFTFELVKHREFHVRPSST
jgi:SAM-dependent methyltransferase